MRKITLTGSVLFVVFMMFLMVSCGGGAKSPSSVATNAVECLADADVDGLLDLMASTPGMEINDETKDQLKELLKQSVKAELDEKGGLKSVKAIEETIAEDGQTAHVKVKMVYGNGEEEIETIDLVKEDDEWKFIFS